MSLCLWFHCIAYSEPWGQPFPLYNAGRKALSFLAVIDWGQRSAVWEQVREIL